MATFVIGDIHGQLIALNDLLTKIEPLLTEKDTLVLLGDYIDRGPDVRGCIDRLLRLHSETPAEVVFLLGNHEDWFLQSLNDPTRHSWLLGMGGLETIGSYSHAVADDFRSALERSGADVITERIELPYRSLLEAMPAGHVEFFRSLKLYHRTPDALCTHAGFDPIVEIQNQSRRTLLWGAEGFFNDYQGPELAAYGHWDDAVVDDSGWPWPNVRQHTIGLDTISHGVLTAIALPQRRVIQSARQAPVG